MLKVTAEFVQLEAGALNLIPGQRGMRGLQDSDEHIVGIRRVEILEARQQRERPIDVVIIDIEADPSAFMVNCGSQVNCAILRG